MFVRVLSHCWAACLLGPLLGGASVAHLWASVCPVVLVVLGCFCRGLLMGVYEAVFRVG